MHEKCTDSRLTSGMIYTLDALCLTTNQQSTKSGQTPDIIYNLTLCTH